MGSFRNFALAWLVLAGPAWALTVNDSRTAASASEQSCTVPRAVTAFQATDRQAFLWFVARHVRANDQLRIEWVDPSGVVSTGADYGELPDAAELCFTAQLPIAGFAPASQPGQWTARGIVNGRISFSRTFTIAAEADNGGPVVSSVTWSGVKTQEIDFSVRGKNFQPNALVLIARYRPNGGWTYLASLQPSSATANQLSVHYAGLPANEYLVIVENPDQRLSSPMPFVIATGGYKMPMPAGVPWVITQGPYGTFSHWGNALHAFDIAPRAARCIVAMKAGIAYTHDLGLHQDHHHRSFGNYITIDHGNGEYSHYAHLATGTFLIKNGQHVEQGQALAIAGNSGYTLGEGGGYHVHVSVTRSMPISAPSIPFQFDDLGPWSRADLNRTVVSENASPLCDCSGPHVAAGSLASTSSEAQFSGQVSVAQWWSEIVAVPRGAKVFEATLSWPDAADRLDLHLVSPSGRHYGWYGDPSGYSGQDTNPQQFQVPRPEPGLWRISVEGRLGGSGPIDFSVNTSGQKPGTRLVAAGHR